MVTYTRDALLMARALHYFVQTFFHYNVFFILIYFFHHEIFQFQNFLKAE